MIEPNIIKLPTRLNIKFQDISKDNVLAKMAQETQTMAPSYEQNKAKIGEIHGTVNLGFKRPVHEGYTFDLTSARLFIENREYQRKVVELLKQFYPNRSVENKNLRVYTVVFSMLNSVVQLHMVWRKKTWLNAKEVSQAEQAAKQLGHC